MIFHISLIVLICRYENLIIVVFVILL
ncbi:MAG: hypothetical protein IJB70_03550 [Clostridia bacterium]|nr:hypothetical protein [Clostridia bacterium]